MHLGRNVQRGMEEFLSLQIQAALLERDFSGIGVSVLFSAQTPLDIPENKNFERSSNTLTT